MEEENILRVMNLRISFFTHDGLVKAVRDLSFDLKKGKTLALVGESGSGKSVTSRAIMGILESNSEVEDGRIIYHGRDLLRIKESEYNHIRGSKISMIFQDTMSTLNPLMLVGKQIKETIVKRNKREKKEKNTFLKEAKKYVSKDFFITLSILEKDEISLEEKQEKIAQLVQNEMPSFSNIYQETKEEYIKKYEALREEILKLKTLLNEEDRAWIKEYKKMKKAYVHLLFPLQIEKDYFVQNFFASFDAEIKDYLFSFKAEEKRMELFETYPEAHYDYYALPLEIRKKEKEIIKTDHEVFLHFGTLMETFLHDFPTHIERLNVDVRPYLMKISDAILSFKKMTKKEIVDECYSLLEEVGLDAKKVYYQYPFELSGGMRQRIVIAIALASSPEILILDEPTTALDVSIQKQILDLIEKLKKERNLSLLFITHDLSVVSKMADDVAIMYGGKIVEYGSVYDIFYDPRHPYTWALLSSLPTLDNKEPLMPIKGNVPDMRITTKGDLFYERNAYALKQDALEMPPFFTISSTHKAATWLLHEYANEVEAPEVLKRRIQKAIKKNPSTIPTYTLKKNSILEAIKKEEEYHE